MTCELVVSGEASSSTREQRLPFSVCSIFFRNNRTRLRMLSTVPGSPHAFHTQPWAYPHSKPKNVKTGQSNVNVAMVFVSHFTGKTYHLSAASLWDLWDPVLVVPGVGGIGVCSQASVVAWYTSLHNPTTVKLICLLVTNFKDLVRRLLCNYGRRDSGVHGRPGFCSA
jgi:hypothetical protein